MYEIALRRRGRSDRHRQIGRAHVRRGAVGRGVDGDRLETFFVTGADDAERDLAAIGDQHPLHGRRRKTEDGKAARDLSSALVRMPRRRVPEQQQTAAEEIVAARGAVVHLRARRATQGELVPARCLEQLGHAERLGGPGAAARLTRTSRNGIQASAGAAALSAPG